MLSQYRKALKLACTELQAFREWDCPTLLFTRRFAKLHCKKCNIDIQDIISNEEKETARKKIISWLETNPTGKAKKARKK